MQVMRRLLMLTVAAVSMFGKGGTPHSQGGMTLSEYRAHLSIWAVLASPLILGADIRTIRQQHPECLELLLNPEIVSARPQFHACAFSTC